MVDEGKWNFTDDYDRRMAIREEAEFRHQWAKHVAWATAVIVVALAICYVRINV